MPSKRRETLDKMRTLGEHWKKTNRVANEKKEKLSHCLSELEMFDKECTACMASMEEVTERIHQSRDGEVEELKSNVEDVIAKGKAVTEWIPENDKHLIEERLQQLRVTWEQVHDLGEQTAKVRARHAQAAEKKEENLLVRETFTSEIKDISTWLEGAEATLKTDMFSVPEEQQMEEILKQEQLSNELEQQRLRVDSILGRRLSGAGLTEEQKDEISEQLQNLATRWNLVQQLSDEQGNHLEQCISQQADYYEELEKCVNWMQRAGESIANDSFNSEDLAAVREELSNHRELCQGIVEQEQHMRSVLKMGKELVEKLPPEQKQAVHDQVTRMDQEWQSLKEQAINKGRELEDYLGETFEEPNLTTLDQSTLQGFASETVVPVINVSSFDNAPKKDSKELETAPVSPQDVVVSTEIQLDERTPASTTVSDIQKYKKELRTCFEMLGDIETKCSEQDTEGLQEVESKFKQVESVIERGELHAERSSKEEKADLQAQLGDLKGKWDILKKKARGRRRRIGRQGSDLERKQLKFDAEIAPFRVWLEKVKNQVTLDVNSADVKVMEKALEDCVTLREDVSNVNPRMDELLRKGEALALEWKKENSDRQEKVQTQMKELRTDWEKMLDRLEIKQTELQDNLDKLNVFNDDLQAVDSAVNCAEKQVFEITSEENMEPVESDLKQLQALLSQTESMESNLSSTLNQGYTIAAKLGELERISLESKLGELNTKLPQLKERAATEIERLKDAVIGKAKVEESLKHCREMLQKAENLAVSSLASYSVEEQLQQATELDAVMASTENPLSSALQKSIETFSKLKPIERDALAAELKLLETKWEDVHHETRERADTLQKKTEMLTECEKELAACNQQLGRIQEDLFSFSPDTVHLSVLVESKDKLEKVLSELDEVDSSLTDILEKGGEELVSMTANEEPIIKIRIATLENKTQDIRDVATLRLAEINQLRCGQLQYQKTSTDLSSWLCKQRELVEETVADSQEVSPVEQLEKMKKIQSELVVCNKGVEDAFDAAEKLAKNLSSSEKEVIHSQLASLQKDYTELRDLAENKVQSLEDQAVAVKCFEDELEKCKGVIEKLEGLTVEEPVDFTKSADIEKHIREKKEKMEEFETEWEHFLQLREEKNVLSTIGNESVRVQAEKQFDEVMKKWDLLYKTLSQSLANSERSFIEEQQIEQNFQDVLSWLDNANKDVSSTLESVSELSEMENRAEMLRNISSECSSYEDFVKSLQEKVQQSPCCLESSYREERASELSSLESKVAVVQHLASVKLEEVQECVVAVNGVSHVISSCKNWLLDQRGLLTEEMPGIEDKDLLETKISLLNHLEIEIGSKIGGVEHAKSSISKKLSKVSSSFKQSLDSELENVQDSFEGLRRTVSSKLAALENIFAERSDFEKQIDDYEMWCKTTELKVHNVLSLSNGTGGLEERLKELQELEKALNYKKDEYQLLCQNKNNCRLVEFFKDTLNTIAQKFTDLSVIPEKLTEMKEKILKVNEQRKQLVQTIQLIQDAQKVISSETNWLSDDSLALEELQKIENLRTQMETLTPQVQSVLANKSLLDGVSGAEKYLLEDKFALLDRSWKEVNESVRTKEKQIKTFVEDKRVYNGRLLQCNEMIDRFEDMNSGETPFPGFVDKGHQNIEQQKSLISEIEAQRTSIDSLGEACERLLLHSDELRPTVMENLTKVKNDWKRASRSANTRENELESWAAELEDFQHQMKSCSEYVDDAARQLEANAPVSFDLPVASVSLVNLRNAKTNFASGQSDLQALVKKGEVILRKVEQESKSAIENSLNKLQQDCDNIFCELDSRIKIAEKLVSDIAEFDQELSHCESLITIYEAAVPKEMTCAVETLPGQIEKLTRLHRDMESRDDRLEALKDNGARIVEQNGSTDEIPKTRAAQLCQKWDELKCKVSVRLKDLQEQARIKHEFDQGIQESFAEIAEVEPAMAFLSDRSTAPLEDKIEDAEALCSKFDWYQGQLDQLAETCEKLPESVVENQAYSPKAKLSLLQKKLCESKEAALRKLRDLEQEKKEAETFDSEVAEVKVWLEKNSLTEGLLSLDTIAADGALSEIERLTDLFDGKAVVIAQLVDKAKSLNDGPKMKQTIDELNTLSTCIHGQQEQLKEKEKRIQKGISQRNQVYESVKTCRDTLHEIETALYSEEMSVLKPEWISEELSSSKSHLKVVASFDQVLSAASKCLEEVKHTIGGSSETVLEANLQSVSEECENVFAKLTAKVSELESIEELLKACEHTKNIFQSHLLDIREPTMQSVIEEADLSVTEDELALCRDLQPTLVEEEDAYNILDEQCTAFCNQSQSNRKEFLVKRMKEVRALKEELDATFSERFQALKTLVAEQQTLEGWLKSSDAALEEGRQLGDKKVLPSDDEQKVNMHIQDLQSVITKLREYNSYSEVFHDTSRGAEVMSRCNEIAELVEKLGTIEEEQKRVRGLKIDYRVFDEQTGELEALFDKCEAVREQPFTPHEASTEAEKLKVRSLFNSVLTVEDALTPYQNHQVMESCSSY